MKCEIRLKLEIYHIVPMVASNICNMVYIEILHWNTISKTVNNIFIQISNDICRVIISGKLYLSTLARWLKFKTFLIYTLMSFSWSKVISYLFSNEVWSQLVFHVCYNETWIRKWNSYVKGLQFYIIFLLKWQYRHNLNVSSIVCMLNNSFRGLLA